MTPFARTSRGFLALLVVLFGGACQNVGVAAEVTVALVAPLSGSSVSGGASEERGAHLAVSAINAAGGVLGRRLRLVAVDDGCDAIQAVAAAELALGDHPKMIVGHYCSGASIAAAPLYARAGVIQITPGSTNPKLTEMGIPTVFRVVGRDDRQGEAAAQLIAKRWSKARVAVLDDGQVYGRGLADLVRRGLRERAVAIAQSATYTPDAASYEAVVRSLKENGIEVLFIGGYPLDIGLMMREIAAARLSIQVLGGDALNGESVVQVAGAASDGVMFTLGPDPRRTPAAAAMLNAARAEGVDTVPDTFLAYAAVEVWAEAARRAGDFEAPAVAAALRGQTFSTVIGELSFDAKGDVLGPAGEWVWYRWKGGKMEPAEAP